MSGCQPRFARSVLAVAFAVNFLGFTSFTSSLHTCYPQAHGNLSWERPGASVSPPISEDAGPSSSSRRDKRGSNGLNRAQACLACLFGAQLRALSLPADVDTAVLSQARRISLPPDSIPAVARIWDIPLPRAPPPHRPS